MSPINTNKVVTTDLNTIRNAIEKIARDGMKLSNPSQGGALFSTSAPDVANLDEGSFQFVQTGGNMFLYTKINGTRYYLQLTAG